MSDLLPPSLRIMVVLVLEFQNQLDFDLILNVFRGVVNGKEGEAAALTKLTYHIHLNKQSLFVLKVVRALKQRSTYQTSFLIAFPYVLFSSFFPDFIQAIKK